MLNRSRFVWMTTFKNQAKYLSCLWRGPCSDLPASWPCSWRSGWPPLKHEATLWLPSSKHPKKAFFLFACIYIFWYLWIQYPSSTLTDDMNWPLCRPRRWAGWRLSPRVQRWWSPVSCWCWLIAWVPQDDSGGREQGEPYCESKEQFSLSNRFFLPINWKGISKSVFTSSMQPLTQTALCLKGVGANLCQDAKGNLSKLALHAD